MVHEFESLSLSFFVPTSTFPSSHTTCFSSAVAEKGNHSPKAFPISYFTFLPLRPSLSLFHCIFPTLARPTSSSMTQTPTAGEALHAQF